MRAIVFAIALAIGATASAQVSGQWKACGRPLSATITPAQAAAALTWARNLTGYAGLAADTQRLHMYTATNPDTGASEIRLFVQGFVEYADGGFPNARLRGRNDAGNPTEPVNAFAVISSGDAATGANWAKALIDDSIATGDVTEIVVERRGANFVLRIGANLYFDAADFPVGWVKCATVP